MAIQETKCEFLHEIRNYGTRSQAMCHNTYRLPNRALCIDKFKQRYMQQRHLRTLWDAELHTS